MNHVERVGLRDLVKGTFVDADEVSVYNILVLVRSHSEVHHWHLDWSEELGTQSALLSSCRSTTFPFTSSTMTMMVKNVNTSTRMTRELALVVDFCIPPTWGMERRRMCCSMCIWEETIRAGEYVLYNMGDEARYFVNPFKGFVRNENVEEKKKDLLVVRLMSRWIREQLLLRHYNVEQRCDWISTPSLNVL